MEKAIVCFSGGHSSALSAIESVARYGKDRVILLNHNISSHVEHEDIKRFKQDVSNYLDIDITYANHFDYENMPPLEVCRKSGTFNGGRPGWAICTYELKTKPFYKWLADNYPASNTKPCENIKIIYGFDLNESERIMRRSQILGVSGYKTEFPLAFGDRTIEKIQDIGIKPPSTYKLFKHANCIGCLKAKKQHWYCVYCLRPDIWEQAKLAECEIGHSIINEFYMEELEIKFKEMRDEKGICPSEKMNAATFWAKVNQIMPGETNLFPCDCSF